jgi:hypothetical protein
MARGYNESGDVVLRTIDGRDLNDYWAWFRTSLSEWNAARDALSAVLTFDTTLPGAEVDQAFEGEDFEESSEFGVPVGLKHRPEVLTLGFSFKDYDLGKRMTWKFLRDATAEQVNALHNLALESDNRNVFGKVMSALFNNVDRTNNEGLTVKSLWRTGDTSSTPPPFAGNTFSAGHNHFFFSGAAGVFDPGDLDLLLASVREHGGGLAGSGTQLLLLINPAQEAFVRALRAGQGSPAAGADFIPAASSAPYLSAAEIVGSPVPGVWNGVDVIGSYGDAIVISNYLIPAGYMVAVASGGPNSARNPIGFREHPQASYRGLVQVPGPRPDYPLIDSYYTRGFGTGVRLRGGAAVMKADTSYTVPSQYALIG